PADPIGMDTDGDRRAVLALVDPDRSAALPADRIHLVEDAALAHPDDPVAAVKLLRSAPVARIAGHVDEIILQLLGGEHAKAEPADHLADRLVEMDAAEIEILFLALHPAV